MRRVQIIVVALIISLMLMGAGYAYWSDTITINNTVKTGDLNVVFDSVFALNNQYEDYDNNPAGTPFKTGDSDYVNYDLPGKAPQITLSEDKHILTFYNENFYPGAGVWLRFKVLNTGTLPAKVKEIKDVVNPTDDIRDYFTYTIGKVNLYKKGNPSKAVTIYNTNKKCNNFGEFVAELSKRLGQYPNGDPIILEPGDWLEVNDNSNIAEQIGYDIFMKTDAPNTITEKKTFQFDLQIIYTQFNAQ